MTLPDTLTNSLLDSHARFQWYDMFGKGRGNFSIEQVHLA